MEEGEEEGRGGEHLTVGGDGERGRDSRGRGEMEEEVRGEDRLGVKAGK